MFETMEYYTDEEYSILTNPYHWWNEWWDGLAEYARLVQMNIDDIVRRGWEELEQCDGKYARVARVYIPILKEFINMDFSAKALYRELLLNQTQPFNEIDRAYGYFGDDDEQMYIEVDSYTGEPLWDDDEALDGKVAPAIRVDEIALSIANAYSDEPTRERAMKASAYYQAPLELDEETFYDIRSVTSEPIRQMVEEDIRLDPQVWYDVFSKARPEITAFNQRRSEFFAFWRTQKPHMHKVTWDEWAMFKQMKFRAMVQSSDERRRFIERLQWFADRGFEPQYIGRLFLVLQNDEWGLLASDADEIRLPYVKMTECPKGVGKLRWFLSLHADDILEDEGSGRSRTHVSEWEILQICDHLEREMLDSMPLVSDTHQTAKGTSSYLAGMLSSIHDPDNMTSAGYAQWRVASFPQGSERYDTVFMQTGDYKKAWRAFYNTAEIVGVDETGVKVIKPMSKKVEFLPWGLARYRARQHELFVRPEKRARFLELSKGRLTL